MKKIVINILKIAFLVVLISWMILFVTDYFKARKTTKPLICLNEFRKSNENGEYYRCTSFGYKYFEIKTDDGKTTYGFGAAFSKSDAEKAWENN